MKRRYGVFIQLFLSVVIACGLFACDDSMLALQEKEDTLQDAPEANKYFKNSLKLIGMIETKTDKLLPLAVQMPPVKHGEWRDYWSEEEQSPQKYVLSMPSIVTEKLNTLYIKPVGKFAEDDYEVLRKIVDFSRASFQTRVVLLENTRDIFPDKAVRKNSAGDRQVSSVYITDVLLKSMMPDDAWGVLAVTTDDIFRAEGLNRLYGDSLRYARRGVISLYHLKHAGKTSLSLALKGASHETTHLLSLPHCVKYRCNMNGRITLEEFEAAPLHYCPDCLCKVIFATGGDIQKRFSELIRFCRENGLKEELDYYSRAYMIIKNNKD